MASRSDENLGRSDEIHRVSEAGLVSEVPQTSDAHRVFYPSSEDDVLMPTPSETNRTTQVDGECSRDENGSDENGSDDNGTEENSRPGGARLSPPGPGVWANDLIQEINNLKKENADLKQQHEARAQTLYETYYGQLKKLYDTDVGFERGQRIQAQKFATQAAQFPGETHDLCRSQYQLLEKARDDVWEQHNQDVNEKRELQENIADLVFRHESLQTKMQEETARSNKLVEALTQSNQRAQDLTARLSELQSVMGSTSNTGSQADIPHNADHDSLRAIHERLMKLNEAAHSQLRAEKDKSQNLQDELDKEQQFHTETKKQLQLKANELDYYMTNLEAQHGVVNKYKDGYFKALADLVTKDAMIVHKDNQLAIMHGELSKWQKQFEIMNTRLDAREKELKSTNNKKPADKPAVDATPKPAAELGTTPEDTTGSPAIAHQNAPTSSGNSWVVETLTSNQVQALMQHLERIEVAVLEGRGHEKERKLLRRLVGDKKAHDALEAQFAALQADTAKQTQDLATKEAEVRRLRDRLDHPDASGCEMHDAELERITRKLDKLRAISLDLTGYIDQGCDALRQCGDAMKEQLRRL